MSLPPDEINDLKKGRFIYKMYHDPLLATEDLVQIIYDHKDDCCEVNKWTKGLSQKEICGHWCTLEKLCQLLTQSQSQLDADVWPGGDTQYYLNNQLFIKKYGHRYYDCYGEHFTPPHFLGYQYDGKREYRWFNYDVIVQMIDFLDDKM